MTPLSLQIVSTLWVLFYVLTALAAVSHALLYKRDSRSAWGWIAVCWLFPLGGAALYWLFGINRVEKYAREASGRVRHMVTSNNVTTEGGLPSDIAVSVSYRELARVGATAGDNLLVSGNLVEPLYNGDQAYPAMLEAIEKSRDSVYLETYIYRDDETGRRFAAALAQAQQRGVRVRVLLDGVSDFYYRPCASRMLAEHGVHCARFLPLRLWPLRLHINLRNHRKLLLVDGEVAFTGGMNVAEYHILKGHSPEPVADLQFSIRGPLVSQLESVFRADWCFADGEVLPVSAASSRSGGNTVCRAITDGPDNDRESFMLVLMAALATAHKRVCIVTPYFVPPAAIAIALQATALRGIEVNILLPQASDQPWIDWATRHALLPLLQDQVRLYFGPAPFTHTKLLLVDDEYVQFGSANLDVRSLRLNFELNVEVYDRALALTLRQYFEIQLSQARRVSPRELIDRRLPERLRDAFFWLFSPYM